MSEAVQAVPRPSAADGGPAGSGGSALFAWGGGTAVLVGCVDLLVAVLLGLADPPVGGADRFTTRELGLAVGAAGLLSFGLAAAAWRGRARDLFAVAAIHALLAGAGWFAGGHAFGLVPRVYLAAVAAHALASAAAIAGAGAAPAEGEDARRRAWSAHSARSGAENLESILVAIVFALAIRHFTVEAYKIPTESMSPTLYGDSSQAGSGDRVLVDKWPVLFGGPERWQVWVFRPPLDRTINYVKRVIGLPGETVEIRDGDIYVDGRIARKPPKTREEMWFPVWPPGDGRREADSPWGGEGFEKAGSDGFRVKGATARRLLAYGRRIAADGSGLSGGEAGDLRLRFDVEEPEPGTEYVVRVTGRGGLCEARIPAAGSALEVEIAGAAKRLSDPFPPPRRIEVSFADLQFTVKADGKTLLASDVEPSPEGKGPRFGVSFGVAKGGATFRDVRLDRDVHYTGSGRWQVPAGCYFFLGDNSANSQDSRAWRGYEFRETAPGGRVFYAADRPYDASRDGRLTFTDRNRVVRSYLPGEISVSEIPVPLSFVPLEDLHGRAFAVFWPPRWFSKSPGGRVRFLP